MAARISLVREGGLTSRTTWSVSLIQSMHGLDGDLKEEGATFTRVPWNDGGSLLMCGHGLTALVCTLGFDDHTWGVFDRGAIIPPAKGAAAAGCGAVILIGPSRLTGVMTGHSQNSCELLDAFLLSPRQWGRVLAIPLPGGREVDELAVSLSGRESFV